MKQGDKEAFVALSLCETTGRRQPMCMFFRSPEEFDAFIQAAMEARAELDKLNGRGTVSTPARFNPDAPTASKPEKEPINMNLLAVAGILLLFAGLVTALAIYHS